MARPSHQWDISGTKHMKIEEEQTVSSNLPVVLQAMEVERLVEGLKSFKLEEVGSKEWMEQHRALEKLNLQAHQNALTNSDEYVMEAFLTFNKLPVLIHDLLVIEAWKTHIYPLLVEDLAGRNNMRLYFILYHEATVVNLLEVFFYYKHVCEAIGEKMIELADYIARKLARLNDPSYNFRECDISELSPSGSGCSDDDTSAAAKKLAAQLEARKPLDELKQHWKEIEFRTSIACVGLARFLSEHADVLPLSTISRITDTHDYLMMIIPLIENPPWTRRLENGKWQKLIDQKWQYVLPIDLLKITKLEGQPWIAVYQLLAKDAFRERYYLNTFRKGQLLRIRKYINDLVLDQLPFLADIQRYMDELAIANVPEPSSLSGNVFLFQQVATLRESIIKGKNFPEIAEYQKEKVFTMTDRNDKDLLAMAELYSDDAIEQVLDGGLNEVPEEESNA